MSESLYLFSAAWGVALVALYSYSQRNRSKLPLPPGPKKLPLVGNVFDMPATFEWETFMEWSKKYDSDILHLNVAGTSIIVLSSAEATNELLEKKAAIYSDRARLPMVNELMGWDFALAFMKYGDHWRAHRRLFHETFNAVATQSFRPKVRAASHELLRHILQEPDSVMDHLRHMAARIIMSAAYGIDVLPADDPYVSLAEEAVEGLVTAVVPGRFLVDSMPLLKYVPEWFPGAGFQRKASEWRRLARSMLEKPYAEAKRNIAAGSATHSFTSDGLRTVSESESENKQYLEQVVKSTAGTMYTAGTGTTVSALGTFILAMLANPVAQKKAQEEIDSVVGQDRLPDFDDEASLPYVAAVMKEAFRWRNVTPIAIPHYLPVDDEYHGYRLPGGSIVIPNTWAILHDEAMYPDPYSFKPERYLLDGKPNPAVTDPDIVFGFGRRICPGRHMAHSSVWMTLVSMLATFDIKKAVGEDGQIIEPTYEYSAGMVVQPRPFKCSITPRSRKALELINATANA